MQNTKKIACWTFSDIKDSNYPICKGIREGKKKNVNPEPYFDGGWRPKNDINSSRFNFKQETLDWQFLVGAKFSFSFVSRASLLAEKGEERKREKKLKINDDCGGWRA